MVEFILIGGECVNTTVAPRLLDRVFNCTVSGDKEYDSDKLKQKIKAQDCIAVIPPYSTRKSSRTCGKHLYKECQLIEKFFSKIK